MPEQEGMETIPALRTPVTADLLLTQVAEVLNSSR